MANDEASVSVRGLIEEYSDDGLTWSDRADCYGGGYLDGGDKLVFIQRDLCPDVEPPAALPNIKHADKIYFMVPADVELPWSKGVSPQLRDAATGEALIPNDADWPDDDELINTIREYETAVREANAKREAEELLKRERWPSSGLYASASWINYETPMLIEGLMRERGVSVIFGAFDEFKTTLALDMMAHVAMGAPWQGRKVKPRPVVWYALEGAEEIPLRMRALEASLKGKGTLWGDDRAPVTVLDRIPEDYRKWRAEISQIAERWEKIRSARARLNDFEMTRRNGFDRVKTRERDDTTNTITVTTLSDPDEVPEDFRGYVIFEDGLYAPNLEPVYPDDFLTEEGVPPVVVIDTLSLALGDDDEKGPRAVGFINDCLDLLKMRPDFACPYEDDAEAFAEWREQHPTETQYMEYPVASHVIVIHHQTKTGTEFAGHRAIAANTQGLYRVHRFGKMTDAERPYAGQLTPQRVKGIPRPAPIRFVVDVVPVEGTKQTAAILKDKAGAIPKDLAPIMKALRALEDREEITPAVLKECLDVVAAKRAKDGAAKRKARQRYRDRLEAAGVIEPVEDDNGKVTAYLFHDVEGV